ncbi:hypothetical protein CROQUDRAFT_663731 [Cronartium quercuum f. sp. fusiforme G11]|uniref:J domain-containing protein n=1 Tax=Cronartium quercuum f. sp. fusiforme G11 TaxID=708437 RepID=A0A9P6T6Z6_9BASI|nr:hypothetical protein CROQUDRAFT_663731 [Cronartium quercuum f. sp. fusiforme G11]
MKFSLLMFSFLTLLLFYAVGTYGWDADDHEIFDLVSALEASEGKGTTFYTFLNITKSATLPEINKAARKRSLELHPDKNRNVKNIEARFARLGVITAILRDQEKRERYNFFHDNGVPKWKGTGYMYSRWQPGLGFVLIFLASVITLVQYGIQHVHYRSELSRIKKFQIAAKQAAYGPKGIQSNSEKSSTTLDKKENSSKQLARKKVKISIGKSLAVGENGVAGDEPEFAGPTSRQQRRRQKQAGVNGGDIGKAGLIEMVVEGDSVWIVTEDGTELPLNNSAATIPSFKNTFIPATVLKFLTPFLPKSNPPPSIEPVSEAVVETEESQLEKRESDSGTKLSDNGTKTNVARNRKTGKSKK